jgi:molybdate transport repressor ModE-like protein
MTASEEALRPRAKFWVESQGAIVMSDWRVRFLEAIDETGSITAASARLKIPYRRLWGKLREVEQNLGVQLVETHAGGAAGGGSRLTEAGRDLVRRYAVYRDGLDDALAQRFREAFEGWPGAQPRP